MFTLRARLVLGMMKRGDSFHQEVPAPRAPRSPLNQAHTSGRICFKGTFPPVALFSFLDSFTEALR